ncbi:MAG: hypothetical protein ACM3S2_06890 [Ignavibacteriales bacterium]
MYEHRRKALLPRAKFFLRIFYHFLVAFGIIIGALLIGILGYHCFEGLGWIDAILNSSMILGGMGPVNPIQTTAGKLFASAYALFSGIVFLIVVGILFAPVFHRFLHKFHLDMDTDTESNKKSLK